MTYKSLLPKHPLRDALEGIILSENEKKTIEYLEEMEDWKTLENLENVILKCKIWNTRRDK